MVDKPHRVTSWCFHLLRLKIEVDITDSKLQSIFLHCVLHSLIFLISLLLFLLLLLFSSLPKYYLANLFSGHISFLNLWFSQKSILKKSLNASKNFFYDFGEICIFHSIPRITQSKSLFQALLYFWWSGGNRMSEGILFLYFLRKIKQWGTTDKVFNVWRRFFLYLGSCMVYFFQLL